MSFVDFIKPGMRVLGCVNCAVYRITERAVYAIDYYLTVCQVTEYHPEIEGLVRLKHHYHDRRMQEEVPVIRRKDVANAFEPEQPIPDPNTDEMQDKFVRILEEEAGYIPFIPEFEREGMRIGAFTIVQFEFVLENMRKKGLISLNKQTKEISATLACRVLYRKMIKAEIVKGKAFMSMAFETQGLDEDVRRCFKETVKSLGYNLVFADEMPSNIGSLPHIIRDKIKSSKFVIADLSEGNQNVYFEAGLAEGWGKPVIPTCNERAWSNKYDKGKNMPFMVRHLNIITWDTKNLNSFASKLKDAVQDALQESNAT